MYLFKQKSAALYYQTGKLVTLIMALMKSVTTPTLYRLITNALYKCTMHIKLLNALKIIIQLGNIA